MGKPVKQAGSGQGVIEGLTQKNRQGQKSENDKAGKDLFLGKTIHVS